MGVSGMGRFVSGGSMSSDRVSMCASGHAVCASGDGEVGCSVCVSMSRSICMVSFEGGVCVDVLSHMVHSTYASQLLTSGNVVMSSPYFRSRCPSLYVFSFICFSALSVVVVELSSGSLCVL